MDESRTTLVIGLTPDLAEAAARLGEQGDRVGLLGGETERLHPYREWLQERSTICEAFPADVADGSSVVTAFTSFAAWSPRLDRLLFHVQAVGADSGFPRSDLQFQRVMGYNFLGFVNCFQLARPMLKRTGGGQAVIIWSPDARAAAADGAAESASRASLQIFVSALRRECDAERIVISELFLGLVASESGDRYPTRAEIVDAILRVIEDRPARHVLGRW
jgi:NAD(P)-dependent dehydrogenase (short-subunit alcohol dehydrogenase family)